MSAANEVAVEAFLAGRIGWVDIAAIIAAALDEHDEGGANLDALTVEHVIDADRAGRRAGERVLTGVAS